MTEDGGRSSAPWRLRAAALAVDLMPGLVVALAAALAALSVPRGGPWWWAAVLLGGAVILAAAVNRVLVPRLTGFSLGRAVTGIDVAPPGSRRRARRLTAGVFVAAAVLTAGCALVGYLTVYQRDHRADLARDQVSRQGPKIVAEMLSYEPDSLDADFDRARSLATPNYLTQLVPQQDAIRTGKPVANLYRVTDGAVLNAAPDRATMLLFLQGQRGKAQLISATVRAVFAKSAGDWRVDDLTVVSKPFAAEEDK